MCVGGMGWGRMGGRVDGLFKGHPFLKRAIRKQMDNKR